jgi:formate hydrogenlyase subunit 3/multisubunit Na+/H+ antiporter MnhD subunit
VNSAWLVLAWSVPLALAPLSLVRGAGWVPVLAPLAALATVGLVPLGEHLTLEWLLLGVHLQLDKTGKLFLLFSALLWLFAAAYGALSNQDAASNGRFRLFFVSSMAGNLLLILAADMLTFYLGFALMGLAAYGMVVHRRSQRARRAGRFFLAWTLVGEVAVLSAVMLLTTHGGSLAFADLAQSTPPSAAVALLVLGFGIKLALPGLHFWLPQTYAVTPVVGAAVLSGPMINAGLLGWLRFLPLGESDLAGWSDVLVAVGAVGVALGVAAGLMQRDPRIVLGYSSVLKMGLITAVCGIALGHPAAAPAILAALVLFALNHLLVKGALFIGIGEWERCGARPGLLASLGLLALVLAGAPLTGGAAAKAGLSAALEALPNALSELFVFAAAATALLMMRFLWLLTRVAAQGAERYGPATRSWLVLVVLALWLPFYPTLSTFQLADALPLSIGGVLGGVVWALVPGRLKARRRAVLGAARWMPWRRLLRRTYAACAWSGKPRVISIGPLLSTGSPMPSLAKAGLTWLWIFLLLLSAFFVSN